MKLIKFLAISVLLLGACSDDSPKIQDIRSEKYALHTTTNGGKEAVVVHAVAKNSAGNFKITIPGTSIPVTLPNESLKTALEGYINSDPTILNVLLKLNSLEFFTDLNLVAEYDGVLYPEKITDDGKFIKSLKYRRTVTNLYISVTEDLSDNFGLPLFGELPFNFNHFTDKDGHWVIYLNYTALKFLMDSFAPALGVPEDIVKMINPLLAQFSKAGDVLEIGLYFNKIK